ncbi:MAG: 7-cyano-7-deazaguanine synthase [Lysobacterales bacterium]|jgi:7-cyano-7-deazaguanine synthase
MSTKKAIVLLSGGLDSATILYDAKKKGFKPYCLIFDYGQRHDKEIKQAKKIADAVKAKYEIVKIQMPWLGSSLLDKSMKLPEHTVIDQKEIPSTYVPARNIIFLSFAASYAEAVDAEGLFIGANAIDYSGYPDCRPDFFDAYKKVMKKGLKTGVKGKNIKIYTPLLRKTKAQIIKMGIKLKVPYELTWSCYAGGRKPCGVCDSCLLRAKGFEEAKCIDLALGSKVR